MVKWLPRRIQIYPSLLFLGVAVLIVVGIVATWNTVQLVTTIKYQQERMAVKRELADVRKVLQVIDANEQYYSMTGNSEYFERLQAAIPELEEQSRELNSVLKKIKHGHKIDIFNYHLNRKANLLQNFIAFEKRGGSRILGLKRLNSRENRQTTKDIRGVMAAIDLAETQAINAQDIIVDRYSLISMIAIVVGLIIAIALVAIFGWRSWREIERRAATEVDLRKAQEAAVVSSRLKSQFLATVSHEIRTPLNGIIGLSDLLKEQVKNQEEKRLANIIHSSGKSLLRIVNDILDFSKIEAGKIELEIQKFSIKSLVQSALELHSLKARSKGLLLMSHLDKDTPAELYGDSARLTQILNNLIGNAIKFTETGEVMVRCRVLKMENSKVHLQFSVEDTGVGISKEEQAYLFKPFNQIQTSTQTKEEGTGLGLSICKSILEKMDGTIRLYSKPNVGSQFIFEIPFDKSGNERLRDTFPHLEFTNVVYVGSSEHLRSTLQTYAYDLNLQFYAVNSNADYERIMGFLSGREKTACLFHPEDKFIEETKLKDNVIGFAILNDSKAHVAKFKSDKTRNIQFPLSRAKFIDALNYKAVAESKSSMHSKASSENSASNLAKGGPQKSNGDGKTAARILVVEDNATNQILIQTYLDKLGYKSHLAANGQEAVEALEHSSYDMIFMDCRMPVMDGFEATEKIRQIEASGSYRTPIIAMTANAMQGDRDKCISAGMDDYLSKPFEPEDLYEIINKWTGFIQQVDKNALEDLASKTNYEVVGKMMESFVLTLEDSLKAMYKAFDENDVDVIKFHSHKLKSSSATLGAKDFSVLCGKVEDLIDDKKYDEAMVEELLEMGDQVLAEMKQLVGQASAVNIKLSDDSLRQ